MKKTNVLNCMFSSWFPAFKNLTFKSIIIPLPQDVKSYLLADGLVLPQGCEDYVEYSTENNGQGDGTDWGDEEEEPSQAPSFPEFQDQITQSIDKLGGQVFPKLNWSSPQDASWVTWDNTTKCSCPRDVYLLLKSSDFVTHDLTLPFSHCEDCADEDGSSQVEYTLVLRQWIDVNLGGEFRCFVHNNTLFAICQRHPTRHFPHIVADKDVIVKDIVKFYTRHIQGKFPDSEYVFDIYRVKDGELYLVDFNPFGRTTDGLMFSWDEDLDGENLSHLVQTATQSQLPEFQYVETEKGMTPNPYQCFKVPQDFVHLAAGEDPAKLLDFINLKIQSQNDDSASSEEDHPAENA